MFALTNSAVIPATLECPVGKDRCLAIQINCSEESDAEQKLVFCKTADTTTSDYYICAKNDDDGWCKDDQYAPPSSLDKTGDEGFQNASENSS